MITISLKQTADGLWSIYRCQSVLSAGLDLGAAIRTSRTLAREEHQRMGQAVKVEMPGPITEIVLASYPMAVDIRAHAQSNALSL